MRKTTLPRKKKPTALHLIDGTYRKDEHGPIGEEVQLPDHETGDAWQPPIWLTDQAREEWDRIVPDLRAVGILARVDWSHIVAYCLAWQTVIDAQKEIEANGVVITGETGGSKKNPAITARHEAMDKLRTFGAEFGIGAASRARTRLNGKTTGHDKKAAASRLIKRT